MADPEVGQHVWSTTHIPHSAFLVLRTVSGRCLTGEFGGDGRTPSGGGHSAKRPGCFEVGDDLPGICLAYYVPPPGFGTPLCSPQASVECRAGLGRPGWATGLLPPSLDRTWPMFLLPSP